MKYIIAAAAVSVALSTSSHAQLTTDYDDGAAQFWASLAESTNNADDFVMFSWLADSAELKATDEAVQNALDVSNEVDADDIPDAPEIAEYIIKDIPVDGIKSKTWANFKVHGTIEVENDEATYWLVSNTKKYDYPYTTAFSQGNGNRSYIIKQTADNTFERIASVYGNKSTEQIIAWASTHKEGKLDTSMKTDYLDKQQDALAMEERTTTQIKGYTYGTKRITVKVKDKSFTTDTYTNRQINQALRWDMQLMIDELATEIYNEGYLDGYEDGYADGYSDGFADGVNSVKDQLQ